MAKGARQVRVGSGGKQYVVTPCTRTPSTYTHAAAYCIFSGLVVAKGGLLMLGRVSLLRQAMGAS